MNPWSSECCFHILVIKQFLVSGLSRLSSFKDFWDFQDCQSCRDCWHYWGCWDFPLWKIFNIFQVGGFVEIIISFKDFQHYPGCRDCRDRPFSKVAICRRGVCCTRTDFQFNRSTQLPFQHFQDLFWPPARRFKHPQTYMLSWCILNVLYLRGSEVEYGISIHIYVTQACSEGFLNLHVGSRLKYISASLEILPTVTKPVWKVFHIQAWGCLNPKKNWAV